MNTITLSDALHPLTITGRPGDKASYLLYSDHDTCEGRRYEMNEFESWGEAISESFQDLWVRFIDILPTVLGAIVVLVVGLFLSSALGRLITRLLRATKVDALVEKTRVTKRLHDAGFGFSVSGLVGWVAKWFLIIVTVIAMADIMNWTQLTAFLGSVALYIPNVLVAILILTIGFIVGHYVHDVVDRSVKASRMPTAASGTLALIAEWAIVIFAAMAALTQLGIAAQLIETLFMGLVAALALAFGLAFGLGGRDKARQWLDKIDDEIKK